jgi:hypothetical protein
VDAVECSQLSADGWSGGVTESARTHSPPRAPSSCRVVIPTMVVLLGKDVAAGWCAWHRCPLCLLSVGLSSSSWTGWAMPGGPLGPALPLHFKGEQRSTGADYREEGTSGIHKVGFELAAKWQTKGRRPDLFWPSVTYYEAIRFIRVCHASLIPRYQWLPAFDDSHRTPN